MAERMRSRGYRYLKFMAVARGYGDMGTSKGLMVKFRLKIILEEHDAVGI